MTGPNMLWCLLLSLAASALCCDLNPGYENPPKSPGDNFYRLLINGEVERYAPGERYVVTLVGSRTHDVLQQFTRFRLTTEPQDPSASRSSSRQGQFQLFADTLSKFDEECVNAVVEADDLPKTEVQVMWKAPPAGSGCILLKAMVVEDSRRWFAEDGQLTRRICEDTALIAAQCCACDDAKYSLVFEGLWSPQTHPKDFPVQALWLTHFSDVIGATHPKNFSFWGEGQIATDGFRSLAEWGSVGLLERELRQQGGLLRSIVKAQGLWHPRVNGNTSAAFTADRRRHLLSLASMFGPSPDWVVGVNSLDLCQKDCTWLPSKVVDLYPYDAGTDNGISYLSPNQETVPREKMYRITTMYPEDPRAPFYDPSRKEIQPMARLYLKREKLVSRSCDEEVLQAMVAEEAENTQSVDKPECAVTEWGPWSACSVTCGKGLRMRTRQYRAPAPAAAQRCDRQLVSKEMCVADVAECPVDNSEPELEAELAPSDPSGICGVSGWGEWSECSVTCGVGVSVRTRHFLNQMGPKKCPLVHTDETRKCMEPPCPEGTEADDAGIPVPGCPVSTWSGWSPCSASCGKGVRFRTRLLLVPADQQAACSSKVELLQQRPCKEKDDCTIDMMTAKRICMEEPAQGPCRGMYQRWAFVAMKGMCIPFSYGGCRGNRNNFLTQEDCMDTCRIVLGGAAAASPQSNQLTSSVSASNPGLAFQASVPAHTGSASSGDCVVSGWSEWSRCSVTCGIGYQERIRTVLYPAGPGGAPCPARMSRRRRCSRSCY